MMYLLTEQEHEQVVDALIFEIGGEPCGGQEALAMLKAIKPALPIGWQYKTNEAGLFVSDQCPDDVEVWNDIEWNKPLYAKEQQ